MKFVQIGILAALLLVAGLLYKIYRGQEAPPAAQPVAAQTATPAPAAAAAAPVEMAPAPAPVTVQAPPAQKPAPAAKQSKPAPAVRNAPVETASAAPPASRGMQDVGAPAPAQQAPAAQTPAPQPEPRLLKPEPQPEAPPAPREPHQATIPAGTVVNVRLGETLSSNKNQPGDTFMATLDQTIVIDGFAIAERGARVEGKVVEAERAGRVKGTSGLTLQLTKLHTSDGQVVNIETQRFHKDGPQSTGDDLKKVGAGAAIGAVIGAIAGGGKGAAIGAGVGGAAGTGTVMATRGKPAEIPVETRLSFRLENAITLTERLK